ncbi:MAG TPA: CGNR zinc finger domain-containing protein [Blastocatellia bacterium]
MEALKAVETSAGDLGLLGGELCLDFVNTLGWRLRPYPTEYLCAIRDLIHWSRQLGAITKRDAELLEKTATASPAKAAEVLANAIKLREGTYRIFAALAAGSKAAHSDLREFNDILAPLLSNTGLVPGESAGNANARTLAWGWNGARNALERLLWPVAWSAANLLGSDPSRVRQCEGEGCGWLFLDTSKNGRRQWCSMKGCGNRAKARRHYEKRKSSV